MTERPEDEPVPEAEPVEVEAVADDALGAGREEKAAPRRRWRGWLFLVLWLLPVVLVLAAGYLVAGQPERLAAFLAGKPPEMATATDLTRVADRLLELEEAVAARARIVANAAKADREKNEAMAGELVVLRHALEAFGERWGARLETLEERVAGLERTEPAVDPVVAAEIAGLEERLAGLEARPAAEGAATIGAESAAAPPKAAMVSLERRLEGLEARGRADGLEARVAAANRAAIEAGTVADKALAELAALRDGVAALARSGEEGAAVKLAVARLRFAVDSGAPFKAELEALQAAGGPGFGAWAARAEQGLSTAASLARQFREKARARTLRPEGVTGTPWLDDAIGRLFSAVSVRQVARDLPGEGPDAALGRAEAHMEEGHLAGAVAELRGEIPPSFDSWLAIARDRLAADAELEAFTVRNDG